MKREERYGRGRWLVAGSRSSTAHYVPNVNLSRCGLLRTGPWDRPAGATDKLCTSCARGLAMDLEERDERGYYRQPSPFALARRGQL